LLDKQRNRHLFSADGSTRDGKGTAHRGAAGDAVIVDDAVAFLKKAPPFQFLDDTTLRKIATNLSMEFYPKGTIILRQDGAPSDALRIIKKGGVKVSMTAEDGSEVVIDYRGEGDNFGFLSMVGQDRVRSNITAVEDTICLLLSKDQLMGLLDSHHAVVEYFLKSHITKYIDRTFQEIQNKSLYYGGSDRLLFTSRAEEFASGAVITVREEVTIREAAGIMAERRISSLVIVDAAKRPVGILTDSDFRTKVVAKGLDSGRPVSEVMSSPIIAMDGGEFCFEAVLKMLRHNIHHILVTKGGEVVGVITNHDLMLLQGTSPLSLTKEIESQRTVEGLCTMTAKMNKITGLLLKEGAKAGNISKIISELNDRLITKVLDIAQATFGAPPLPYCFVVLGSEGRKEQTFKTDQDNALIWADTADPAQEREAEEYFGRLAEFVSQALASCHFPACPAGYMASNPLWRQPLATWKRYLSDWVGTPRQEVLIHALVFSDMRPVFGEFSLVTALRNHLAALLQGNRVFLGHLANLAVQNAPPIGFLKAFVVEKGGEHKNELNLKVKGIAPLIDIVRLFALERDVRETSTLERIEHLKETHTIVSEHAAELEYALELFTLMRIHHQYEQMQNGEQPDNFINPTNLSTLEKKTMKDAFGVISSMQDMIIERYKPMII
jgi:CBS domain-containing protein